MRRAMDRLEQAAVREFILRVRFRLGLGDLQELTKELAKRSCSAKEALECLRGRPVNRIAFNETAQAALEFMSEPEQYGTIEDYLNGQSPSTRYLIQSIMCECASRDILPPKLITDASRPSSQNTLDGYAGAIFNTWCNTFYKGNEILRSGIYQMFRRYKPEPGVRPDRPDGAPDPSFHPVICELILVDSEEMECILVTSERNVYHGSLFINDEKILYGLLQRRWRNNGVNQRVITLRLESKRLPIYSGLCLKTGDTTRRPIGAESLYVWVKPDEHPELVGAMQDLRRQPWSGESTNQIDPESVILEYVTANPPPEWDLDDPRWRTVKFLEDFPLLTDISKPDEANGVVYLREPSRTLSSETVLNIAKKGSLPVFRWHRD